jgi:hypothetical protein
LYWAVSRRCTSQMARWKGRASLSSSIWCWHLYQFSNRKLFPVLVSKNQNFKMYHFLLCSPWDEFLLGCFVLFICEDTVKLSWNLVHFHRLLHRFTTAFWYLSCRWHIFCGCHLIVFCSRMLWWIWPCCCSLTCVESNCFFQLFVMVQSSDYLVHFHMCRPWDLVSPAGSVQQQQATWALDCGFKHSVTIF